MSSNITQLPVNNESPPVYQCEYCSRGFSRQDHLNRHIRTHTLERPYACAVCDKTFARARHENHHSGRRSGTILDSSTGRRVSQACKSCASSKLKCSHGKPCVRCVRKGVPCEYDHSSIERLHQASRYHSNKDSVSDLDDNNQGDTGDRHNEDVPHPLLSPISDHSLLRQSSSEHPATYHPPSSLPPTDSTSMQVPPHSVFQGTAGVRSSSNNGFDLLRSSAGPPRTDGFADNLGTNTLYYSELLKDILGSGTATPLNMEPVVGMESSNDFWDQYLSTGPNFENMENLFFPEGLNPTSTDVQMAEDENDSVDLHSHLTPSFEETTSSAGTKAFRESGWEWGPTAQDCSSAGHPSLILPTGLGGSDEIAGRHFRRTFPSSADRHRILSLLLRHCEKETWVRIASSFPSVSTLEAMLQRFFATQGEDFLSWFHFPSFKCENIRDELLTAMVAFGACLTPIDSVQRFGFAMPEILRYAVVEQWSQDNSTSRDIQLLQTCLIVALLSCWSGDKRKMEIGEGNFQPLITIIRRARWLRNEQYTCIHPQMEDEGQELHRKWQLWTEQESKKRLIYRAFVLDAQMSMMNHVNPSMSYAEMRVPMPEPDELWFAGNAEAWKNQYFKLYHLTPLASLTLANAFQLILTGKERQQQEFTPTSTLYILYGFWNLVWEYQQLQETLNLEESHETSILLLPSRREMLMKALNSMRIQTDPSTEIRQPRRVEEPMLVLEYLCMALHVPLQGLQAFAGRDGEQEARKIYPTLQEWVQTREARQALWHAGQVYRLAKKTRSRSIRDQHLMLIYQASITFWAYGIITSVSPIVGRSRLPPLNSNSAGNMKPGKVVWLDGDNNTLVRRFVAISEGEPALSSSTSAFSSSTAIEDSENTCMVADASATTMLAVDIINRLVGGDDGAQIPLIGSVTRLMKEIAKIAKVIQPQ